MSTRPSSDSSDCETARLEHHPAPDADGAGDRPDQRSRQQHAARVPNVDECLHALGQLPGLVALGMLKPGQANAIRATYREILQHHQRSQQRDRQDGLSNADVLELARTNPAVLNMLEPLLTDEQIQMVMRNAEDGEGG